MLIVTEAACSLAAELLDNAQAVDDVAVRLFFEGDDLAMQMDHRKPANRRQIPEHGMRDQKAGDGIRTHDIHVGNVTLYH